jgi:hypothetical protein
MGLPSSVRYAPCSNTHISAPRNIKITEYFILDTLIKSPSLHLGKSCNAQMIDSTSYARLLLSVRSTRKSAPSLSIYLIENPSGNQFLKLPSYSFSLLKFAFFQHMTNTFSTLRHSTTVSSNV